MSRDLQTRVINKNPCYTRLYMVSSDTDKIEEEGKSMGIIRVTAFPSKYAYLKNSISTEDFEEGSVKQQVGKMYISFIVKPFIWNERIAQREIAKALGRAMAKKPVYHKGTEHTFYDYGRYEVGGWNIEGLCVTTALFDLESVQEMLNVLSSLKGIVPDGELSIYLVPERYDIEMVYNLNTIIEARKELIRKALSFEDDFMFIASQYPMLSIPLDFFNIPVIEASVFLYHQITQMAWTTKKVRMKPCDMSNPKYNMRTWLLRLGFIGAQFERPRRTLLAKLDGNTAFFTEENRQKALGRAKDKRRQDKAHALLES